jgi:acetyl-CoA synthetase
LYFTSGTTAKPKLVQHSHASYPAGHLSTTYWLGLQPGDLHWNISSPGWGKHAWSNFFGPWNAEATVFVYRYLRFDAKRVLALLESKPIHPLCAPPTVWRMLIQEDLASCRVHLRDATSAGEPLNPEVLARVRAAWGVDIRDGYGQTETTAMVGNPPGQPIRPGSMGRPLPGYRVDLLDVEGRVGAEGEICVALLPRPLGLLQGYAGDPSRTAQVLRQGWYHTGDIAVRDDAGYITYIGRSDDVFKSADYRISPFELENVLMKHPAVAEAAVVPFPDPVRLAVPKAFIALAAGYSAEPEVARSIFAFVRESIAPYKRIRRLAFAELPKTLSGKVRRTELRQQHGGPEFREEDFPR